MVSVDDIKKMTFDAVLDHGHAVVHSPATDRVPAPYSYTAGRTMRGRPEIVITGGEPELREQLLNVLAAYDDVEGLYVDTYPTVAGYVVKIIEANPAPLSAAILSFGVIKVVQALLPNEQFEYPDTLRGRTSAQPVLPLIPGDAWDPYDEEEN